MTVQGGDRLPAAGRGSESARMDSGAAGRECLEDTAEAADQEQIDQPRRAAAGIAVAAAGSRRSGEWLWAEALRSCFQAGYQWRECLNQMIR